MVSLSNWATLALIGGGILAFYKLGGASGIGSRLGGGFSTLFDSFSSTLNFPTATATKQADPYPEWLASYGVGDGVLDVVKKDDKYCVGGFCFDEDPNLAATPPSPIDSPDGATTTNTGGFIQTVQNENIKLPAYVGSLDYIFSGNSASDSSSLASGWDSSSLKGVNITGSYTSSSSGGGGRSGGSSGGGTSGGGSSGGSSSGSGSGGSSGGGSSGGGSSGGGSSGGGSSGGGSSGGGSSGGGSGGSSGSSGGSSGGGGTGGGTGSRGGQGAGRSSNRGR
jgi:hypothetical protein